MDAEAEGGREDRGTRWLKRGLQGAAGLLLFALGAFVMQTFVRFAMQAYAIPSSAMEPTLHCGPPGVVGCEGKTNDRILVVRFHPFWAPRRGDIVVFETPPEAKVKCGAGGTFVKRIVGLPGETVQERLIESAGYVYIDGKKLDEPYIQHDRRDIGPAKSWRVPKGSYFMMGDNRASSCDSRQWGSVPRHNLVGPVVALYWPLDRIGLR